MKRKSVVASSVAAVIGLATLIGAAPARAETTGATQVQMSDVELKLNPSVIALCNAGLGDVSVQNFQAKGLGKIDLRCGDGSSGYVHIRARHQSDWQTVISQAGGGAVWDDFMVYAVNGSVASPSAGYPINIGNNKWCYSTPIQIKNSRGVVTKTLHPTVIVSVNNRKVITAFPTTSAPNCNGG